VFEGLLPEPYNTQVLQLLFVAAYWHGLAKLRLHTDLTLDIMDNITTRLGDELRKFSSKTCTAYETRELQREADARVRRQTKSEGGKGSNEPSVKLPGQGSVRANTGQPTSTPANPTASRGTLLDHLPNQTESLPAPSTHTKSTPASLPVSAPKAPTGRSTRRRKTLNINTYKAHSLGDYTKHIRMYGTTDGYSTEPVRG